MVISPQSVPISEDAKGVWRVEGTRVSVDSIVYEFRRGATPEQIQDDFPTLSLAKIYSILSFYLNHQREVDNYLSQQESSAQEERTRWGNEVGDLRASLRSARDAQAQRGLSH